MQTGLNRRGGRPPRLLYDVDYPISSGSEPMATIVRAIPTWKHVTIHAQKMDLKRIRASLSTTARRQGIHVTTKFQPCKGMPKPCGHLQVTEN